MLELFCFRVMQFSELSLRVLWAKSVQSCNHRCQPVYDATTSYYRKKQEHESHRRTVRSFCIVYRRDECDLLLIKKMRNHQKQKTDK